MDYSFLNRIRALKLWVLAEKPLLVLFGLTFIAVGVHFYFAPVRVAKNDQSTYAPLYFQKWRQRFLVLHKTCDTSGLVRGVFLGEDAFVSDKTREVFHQAGLMHLLAASGFNCWLVAFFFSVMAKLLIYFAGPSIPSTLFLRLRVWAPQLCLLLGAWLFWLWSDQSAPITRSAVLMSTKFVFWFFWWRVPFARLLLVQYLVSLCFVPRLWNSASFQLTFGCLFGLVYFPKLAQSLKQHFIGERLERKLLLYPKLGRLLGVVWFYTVANLGACLGTIPTTYFVFGEINFSSLLTNWFATPYASFVLMPLAFFTMLFLAVPGAQELALIQNIAALNSRAASLFEIFLAHAMRVLPSLLSYW